MDSGNGNTHWSIDTCVERWRAPSREVKVCYPSSIQSNAIRTFASCLPRWSSVYAIVGKAPGNSFLFDSGASTNYVSSAFANMHGLTVRPSETNVRLGTGTSVSAQGECAMHIKLGDYQDRVECYVLDMVTDFQMILEDTWLNMVKATFDYDSKKCIIRKNNKRFTLSSSTRSMLRCKLSSRGRKEPPMLSAMQVKRALKRGDQAMMVQLSELKLDSRIPADKKLADLLKEYEDVFKQELPCGLPPERNVGHSIPVEPGAPPPFRPTYRLSPVEQAEVKSKLTDLLEKGLVEAEHFSLWCTNPVCWQEGWFFTYGSGLSLPEQDYD
jgi:hypothetical protein